MEKNARVSTPHISAKGMSDLKKNILPFNLGDV